MVLFTINPENVTTRLAAALDPDVCPNTTLSGRFQQNSVVLFLSLAEIVMHSLDLAVFRLWRNKEPYVTFHVALAATSVVLAVLQCVSPLSRLLATVRWTPGTRTMVEVSLALFTFIRRTYIINMLFISIDRWLSVEYAHQYRTLVTKRKVKLAIMLIWIVSAVITVPGIVVLRNGIDVSCSRLHTFRIQEQSTTPWRTTVGVLANGPYLVPLLFIFQLRILMIAVTIKLRHLQRLQHQVLPLVVERNSSNRQGGRWHNAATDVQSVVRIVWGNLLASMMIVVVAVAASFPYTVIDYMGIPRTVLILQLQNFTLAAQPLCPPLIYLLFFPQFRVATRRLVRILACSNDHRVLVHVKVLGMLPAPDVRSLSGPE